VRQRGPLDAVTGVVGDAAGALRRRREARRPYVKLYAADGQLTMLDPASETAAALIEVAASMVDAAAPPEKSASSGVPRDR
jgi:predicted component of type VI protein secretion system